jgi:hypothetical protein
MFGFSGTAGSDKEGDRSLSGRTSTGSDKEGDRSLSGRAPSTGSDKEKDRSLDGRGRGRTGDDGTRDRPGGPERTSGGSTVGTNQGTRSVGRDSPSERGGRFGGGGLGTPGPVSGGSTVGTSMGTPSGGMMRGIAEDRATRETAAGLRSLTGDQTRRADLESQRRASENTGMAALDRARQESATNSRRADLETQRRTSETKSAADLESLKASYRDGIASIESVGEDDPYAALGKWTKGDRAYGRYQVMGKNIPSWTRQAIGYSMTPKEFLANPKAQDATFDHIFGGYVAKHGLEQAAQAWYGGEGSIGKLSRTDVHGRVNVGQYGRQFAAAQERSYDARKRGLDGSTDVAGKTITDRFASTYLGEVGGPTGRTNTITGVSPEVAFFGEEPRGQTEQERREAAAAWEERFAAEEDRTPTDAGMVRPASVTSDEASVYGNEPVAGEGEFPDRPRSTGETVAAVGLDVGMGMLPGIGMGLSLVNGGLALTGNRTLGERIVDAVATGEGGGGTFTPGDPNRDYEVAVNEKDEATTVPKKPETFEEKYLAFVDTTKRPTPDQRWGMGAGTYGQSEYG